jgi:hypothetical protein
LSRVGEGEHLAASERSEVVGWLRPGGLHLDLTTYECAEGLVTLGLVVLNAGATEQCVVAAHATWVELSGLLLSARRVVILFVLVVLLESHPDLAPAITGIVRVEATGDEVEFLEDCVANIEVALACSRGSWRTVRPPSRTDHGTGRSGSWFSLARFAGRSRRTNRMRERLLLVRFVAVEPTISESSIPNKA